jgi:hypothetical protein
VLAVDKRHPFTKPDQVTWWFVGNPSFTYLIPFAPFFAVHAKAVSLTTSALGSGNPGREIEGPMAIVILGGFSDLDGSELADSSTLSLRYGRFEVIRADEL